MTGLLVARDPSRDRRRTAARAAEALLRQEGCERVGTHERGDVAVVWGGSPATPVDTASTDRADAVVLGDLVDGDGWRSARQLAERRSSSEPADAIDGYHLAVVVGDDGSLTVEADPLGLLPVYHLALDDVVLAATGPGLLRAHERFLPRLDPAGLAGVLLTDGLVAGRSVHRHVRRLAAGHVLRADARHRPVEVPTAGVTVSDALHDAPFEGCAEALHDALVDALQRHVRPGRRHALLLSGGRDSRLLAGALTRHGMPFEGVTFGRRSDLEHRSARRVARALGMEQRLLPDAEDEACFEQLLRREGLVSTPTVALPRLPAGTDRLLSGYAMDTAWASTAHVERAYDRPRRRIDHQSFLAQSNRHAVERKTLHALLQRPWFQGCLEQAEDDDRSAFEAGGDSELERAWRHGLRNRARFWLGKALWRCASGPWPSIPQVDQRLLATAAGVPLAMLGGRRLQDRIFQEHYPELARIPLDRTTFETAAIAPRLPDLLRSSAERHLRGALDAARLPTVETRYNTRRLDIGRPGWAAVRERLEPMRASAHDLFDPATFDAVLPPPGEPLPGRATYPDSNAAKLLLGVMALLADGTSL